MCHFKEIGFWSKNMFVGIGDPKMVLKLVQNDLKMILKLSKWYPPKPIPGVSKSLLQMGANKFEKTYV